MGIGMDRKRKVNKAEEMITKNVPQLLYAFNFQQIIPT
jgi:hypothetical protein